MTFGMQRAPAEAAVPRTAPVGDEFRWYTGQDERQAVSGDWLDG